jgi:hypothetical protein
MSRADGNVRTLVLPHGGTIDIPLPGARGEFAIRQGSFSGTCPNLLPTVLIPLVFGLAVGIGVTAWWMHRR